MSLKSLVQLTFILFIQTFLNVNITFADGSERLGTPSLTTLRGSGCIASGVGLTQSQPATIVLHVPVTARIKQVLLYWEGRHSTPAGDNSIMIAGTSITGALIGGPDYVSTINFGATDVFSSTYRADVTSLAFVSPGTNSIPVQGLNFDIVNNGAGIVVIYDDGSSDSRIQLVDGNDLAYRFAPAPRTTTIPQTLFFDPAPVPRVACLTMFFCGVDRSDSPESQVAPSRISVTTGGVTTNYDNQLNGMNGEGWDTYTVSVNIPAWESMATVQAISGPGGDNDPNTPMPKPASFTWVAAGFSIPCVGGIGDLVWNDIDQDGSQDDGESGIAGVTVTMADTESNLSSTVTDSAGHFQFTNLSSGMYTVTVDEQTLPEGFVATRCSNSPNTSGNSNCSPAKVTVATDGTQDRTIDFGFYRSERAGEGCPPDFWKKPRHFDSWPSPYGTTEAFSAIFEDAFPGKSLLSVLKGHGHGLTELGRHTVAALLNAGSGDIDFSLTTQQVISMFNSANPGTPADYRSLQRIFSKENGRRCPLHRFTGNEEESSEEVQLLQNYPNPFNPSTEISIALPETEHVTLRVYNTLGQEVKTLVNTDLEAGTYAYVWDATDAAGKTVSSGVYFYQLRAGDRRSIKKMSYMR